MTVCYMILPDKTHRTGHDSLPYDNARQNPDIWVWQCALRNWPVKQRYFAIAISKFALPDITQSLVQTVESPKGLSGKIGSREVSREFRLSRWAQPEGKSDYPMESRGKIFRTIPKIFSLFVKLSASNTEEDAAQSCQIGLSGETVVSD